MKPLRTLALAGAALLVVGGATIAAAAIKNSHVLTVRLPDGSVEQIRYIGDVAPSIRFETQLSPAAALQPFDAADQAMFARLQQMSAQMDQQAAAMMRGLADGAGPAGGLTVADFGKAPAGARGVTTISTLSGSGVCSRSVEYTSTGDGKPVQVVSRVSGDCGGAGAPTVSSGPAAPRSAPGMVKASYATDGSAKAVAPGVWN